MTVKERLDKAAEQTKKASAAIGEKLSQAGKIAKESARTIAVQILDQDGDGKIDQTDLKIITNKGIDLSKKAASEASDFAKEIVKDASKSQLVKDAAGGAMVGAAIAIPVPGIGPIAGAAIGASIGVYGNITKGGGNSSESKPAAKKKSTVRKIAKKVTNI